MSQEAEDAVRTLLSSLGERVEREGLKDTPARVVRALREMTSGYEVDPREVLSRTFAEECDEVVVVRDIAFTSLCEHHVLPFTGTADVGYLPGKVVGLSKIARLVDCFARRLQIQERLTRQIAVALMEHLGARGAGVILRAHHACMGCRGVLKPRTEMVTSCMLGVFRDDRGARQELLALCRG
jgi:GTP cyclohydrolase I